MTPDDQALLIDFGENIFLQALQVIIFVAGWGLFVGMSLALYLALRNSEGKPNKMMVLCLIGIFMGFTWTAGGAAGSPLDYIQLAFIKHPSKDLAAQGDLVDDKTAFWSDMSLWSETVNLVLGDFIVVWRAWILFREQTVWKVILVILMGANTVINIIDCIFDNADVAQINSLNTNVVDATSIGVSLATNLFATLMIVVKAMTHFRFLRQASSALWHRSQPLHMMLLLIESGAVFCALQVLGVIAFGLNTLPTSFQFNIFLTVAELLFNLSSALYPIVVFILIHTNLSPVNQTWIESTLPGHAYTMDGSATMATNHVTESGTNTQSQGDEH